MNPYTLTRQPHAVRVALADRFKRFRKAAGLTQVELAERSTVSLRRFESTGEVSLKHLSLLADVLGRLGDLDSLFVFSEARA